MQSLRKKFHDQVRLTTIDTGRMIIFVSFRNTTKSIIALLERTFRARTLTNGAVRTRMRNIMTLPSIQSPQSSLVDWRQVYAAKFVKRA